MMKQLTKVQIKEFVEMTNREMKHVVGGIEASGITTTTTSGVNCEGKTAYCNGTYWGGCYANRLGVCYNDHCKSTCY